MNYLADKASIDSLAVELAKRALIGTLSSNHSSDSAYNNQVHLKDLIRNSNLTRLHMLAERLVRANNIRFHIYNKGTASSCPEEGIECYLSPDLIGEFVNFVNVVCSAGDERFINDFFEVPIEVQIGIRRAKVDEMRAFITQIMRHYQITFSVDLLRIRSFQHSVDKTLDIEEKKEYLLLNKAPVDLMRTLYSEESDKSLGVRKRILQVHSTKGRPRVGTDKEYHSFVRSWESHSDKPMVDRFIKVHEQIGLDFSILYGFYKRNLKDQCEIAACRKMNNFGMPNRWRSEPDFY